MADTQETPIDESQDMDVAEPQEEATVVEQPEVAEDKQPLKQTSPNVPGPDPQTPDDFINAYTDPNLTVGTLREMADQGATTVPPPFNPDLPGTPNTTDPTQPWAGPQDPGAPGTRPQVSDEVLLRTKVYDKFGTSNERNPNAFQVLGTFPDLPSLIAAHPTGNQGDVYLVGSFHYMWSDAAKKWIVMRALQAPTAWAGEFISINTGVTMGGQSVATTQFFNRDPYRNQGMVGQDSFNHVNYK